MAGTSYTRQSTIADGNIITAALFNNEFNQILNAFAYASAGTTGHSHDGSAGQGAAISKIGDQDFKNKIEVSATNNRIEFYAEVGGAPVEQVRIQDGAIVPVTDSDVDLGTNSVRFKDLYVDSISVGANTIGATTSYNGDVEFVGDATPSSKITFDKSLNALHFADNMKLSFGQATATPGDLVIYHDESHSYISDFGTGNLKIRGEANIEIGGLYSAPAIVANSSGVEFRASNTLQASVVSTGLSIPDNKFLSFGTDNDLQIYHDTNNSYIKEGGTGSLILVAFDQIKMTQTTGVGSFPVAEFGINTGCELFHSTSKKFNTTSTGVTVTGNASITGAATAQAFTANALIDTPTLEVTTLKARDGTAAGSIADSTGIVTLASSVLTTADINGGTVDGSVIGGSTAAAGTFTTINGTTSTVTTSNATTVDTTNLEVTNLKAKDGTDAGSIADSTGVVTLASSVLTTADINGGAIDGTVIGGSTAAAGSFTTLNTTNDVTITSATPELFFVDTTEAGALGRVQASSAGLGFRSKASDLNGAGQFGNHTFSKYDGTNTETQMVLDANNDIRVWNDSGAVRLFWDASHNSSSGGLAVGQAGDPQATLDVHGNAVIKEGLQIGETQGGISQSALDIRGTNAEQGNFVASVTAGVMSVTSVNNANLAVGDVIYSANAIPAHTFIKSFGTGTGGTGTYNLSQSFDLSSLTLRNSAKGSLTASFTNADTTLRAGQPIGTIEFNDADSTNDGAKGFLVCGAQDTTPSSYLAFGTHKTGEGEHAREVARIDENGNFLLNAIASNQSLNHVELRPDGEIRVSAVNSRTGTFTSGADTTDEAIVDVNRTGSDGAILKLQQGGVDNLKVYSTGANNPIIVGGDDKGILMNPDSIKPRTAANAALDGVLDLGASDSRFKDFYLSGGVYLGGTSAVNKLEDYEEGSWSPQYVAATTNPVYDADTHTQGRYTKIGRVVHAVGRIRTHIGDNPAQGSGQLAVSLPFTVSDDFGTVDKQFGILTVGEAKGFLSNQSPNSGFASRGTSRVYLNKRNEAEQQTLVLNAESALDLTSNDRNDLVFSVTYFTDA